METLCNASIMLYYILKNTATTVFLLIFCSFNLYAECKNSSQKINDILREQKNVPIFDIRDKNEYQKSHVKNSVNISLKDAAANNMFSRDSIVIHKGIMTEMQCKGLKKTNLLLSPIYLIDKDFLSNPKRLSYDIRANEYFLLAQMGTPIIDINKKGSLEQLLLKDKSKPSIVLGASPNLKQKLINSQKNNEYLFFADKDEINDAKKMSKIKPKTIGDEEGGSCG